MAILPCAGTNTVGPHVLRYHKWRATRRRTRGSSSQHGPFSNRRAGGRTRSPPSTCRRTARREVCRSSWLLTLPTASHGRLPRPGGGRSGQVPRNVVLRQPLSRLLPRRLGREGCGRRDYGRTGDFKRADAALLPWQRLTPYRARARRLDKDAYFDAFLSGSGHYPNVRYEVKAQVDNAVTCPCCPQRSGRSLTATSRRTVGSTIARWTRSRTTSAFGTSASTPSTCQAVREYHGRRLLVSSPAPQPVHQVGPRLFRGLPCRRLR